MPIKSYRELRVWQAAMDLVEHVYALTRSFPGDEIYGLTNQLRRAVVSVPSNIAEGHTRESTKEYLYHLSVAQASLAEVETQIEIAVRLQYLATDQHHLFQEQCSSVGRQLFSLKNAFLRKGLSQGGELV